MTFTIHAYHLMWLTLAVVVLFDLEGIREFRQFRNIPWRYARKWVIFLIAFANVATICWVCLYVKGI